MLELENYVTVNKEKWYCGAVGKAAPCNASIPHADAPITSTSLKIHLPAKVFRKAVEGGSSACAPPST